MRFVFSCLFFFILGTIVGYFKPEQKAYFAVSPSFFFDEETERILTRFENSSFFSSVKYLKFPKKIRFKDNPDCDIEKSENFVRVTFNKKCQAVDFILKKASSVDLILAQSIPSLWLIIVSSVLLSLLFLSSWAVAFAILPFYCIWLFGYSKFNAFYLPLALLITFILTTLKPVIDYKCTACFIPNFSRIFVFLCLGLNLFVTLVFYDKTARTIFHPDEPIKILQIERLLADKPLEQSMFLHPLALVKSGASFVRVFGEKIDRFEISFYSRLASLASFLVLTAAIFMASNRIWNNQVALNSVLIWVSWLLPFVASVAIKEDMIFCLWTGLNILSLLFFFEKPGIFRIILVFVTAGFAFSSKYTGVLTVMYSMFLVFVKMASSDISNFRRFVESVSSIVLGASLSFAVFCVINEVDENNFGKFLRGFLKEVSRVEHGHTNILVSSLDYMFLFYFFETFFRYENILPSILIIGGLFYAIRHLTLNSGLIVLLFLFYYFVCEINLGKAFPQFHRYLLPGYIFASMLIGYFVTNSSFGRMLLLLHLIVGFYVKGKLAFLPDTTQVALTIVQSSKGLFSKIVFFGYSFPRMSLDKQYFSVDNFLQKLPDKDDLWETPQSMLTNQVMFAWNSFFCERYHRGQINRRAWVRFVQCELFQTHGEKVGSLANAFWAKPFFNSQIDLLVFDMVKFQRMWNESVEFGYSR
ncbi:MAG: hypothetical protein NZT61_01695 [Deltaproteobacteria bacterium]|nr:hypothetical protein [Deltaproteobacteria bacterium]